ncbi:hypothetical protein VH86_24495, partial [Pantoea sp. BL1]
MVETGIKVCGLGLRNILITAVGMARTIVIHLPVRDVVTIAPRHIGLHRPQHALCLTVVIILSHHSRFNHVMGQIQIPDGFLGVVFQARWAVQRQRFLLRISALRVPKPDDFSLRIGLKRELVEDADFRHQTLNKLQVTFLILVN